MGATLTHSLAKNINMRGINGKIGFQHLQIKDVVIGKFVLRLTDSLTDSLWLCIFMAGFTLQVLMPNSEFLPISDFWNIAYVCVFQRLCDIIVWLLMPRTKKLRPGLQNGFKMHQIGMVGEANEWEERSGERLCQTVHWCCCCLNKCCCCLKKRQCSNAFLHS